MMDQQKKEQLIKEIMEMDNTTTAQNLAADDSERGNQLNLKPEEKKSGRETKRQSLSEKGGESKRQSLSEKGNLESSRPIDLKEIKIEPARYDNHLQESA